ncbi:MULTISPECIES: hypothetical protein [Methylomicrobium]|uniref:Uncharacterized protein n=1 Tax=Methylomicrobium album BG8 TaxID=686340 RepID=H8GJ17_METAL|nr:MULTISPECIES: hypothetical protein [Methylomicrobium]EIC31524.1 hypothetical protein Metal_3887 [Methylomicrobium album BG8]
MTRNTLRLLSLILAIPLCVNAGTLANGKWSLADCGNKPEVPAIDQTNVEAFNRSVAKINTWQQQAKAYYECLVKEANTDNAVIADTANAAQAEYRATVESIGRQADAAKKKLESK